MDNYELMTIGQIITDRFCNANVLNKYGIDLCCSNDTSLTDVCLKHNIDISLVIEELVVPENIENHGDVEFNTWPIDLLCDYVLKYHHRNARKEGPEIQTLLNSVCNAHGEQHPELLEIRSLFTETLPAVCSHLDSEENDLFPLVYKLYKAKMAGVSAPLSLRGTTAGPINTMVSEHTVMGVRNSKVKELANNFQVPSDACAAYKLLMYKLNKFYSGLHQHTYIENEIIAPETSKMEKDLCK